MKLLFENWRRYLIESRITKLRIFDFDETIAFTNSSVRIVTPDGTKVEFPTQKDYDRYIEKMKVKLNIKEFDPVDQMIQMGYKFDYSDFSKVIDPQANNTIIKILQKIAGANNQDPQREVYIMTARASDSREPIMNYLLTLNKDDGTPMFKKEDFSDVITLAGESKREAIEKLINKHSVDGQTSIRDISFFDDSQKNLDDVMKLREKYPNINIAIEKVNHDTITSLEEKKMNKLFENWRRFINESQKVWKTEKAAKRGKASYTIIHEPSGMIIPSSYYINFSRKSQANEFIEFLTLKANEENWTDIDTDRPSEETLKSLHNTIINSKYKNPNFKHTLAEDDQDTIIGIPGGFKPPHKGHVAMINHYLEKFPKAKIVIYMGSKPRHDSTKEMEFGILQSKKVFKLYFDKGVLDPSRVKLKDKVKQREKKAGGVYENPMSDIIELVGDTSLAGSRVGMGYAAKEKHYGASFMKGSQKFTGGPSAFDPGPAEWGTALQGISATKMRNAIKNQNLKTIQQMIPDGISAEEYLALFK